MVKTTLPSRPHPAPASPSRQPRAASYPDSVLAGGVEEMDARIESARRFGHSLEHLLHSSKPIPAGGSRASGGEAQAGPPVVQLVDSDDDTDDSDDDDTDDETNEFISSFNNLDLTGPSGGPRKTVGSASVTLPRKPQELVAKSSQLGPGGSRLTQGGVATPGKHKMVKIYDSAKGRKDASGKL